MSDFIVSQAILEEETNIDVLSEPSQNKRPEVVASQYRDDPFDSTLSPRSIIDSSLVAPWYRRASIYILLPPFLILTISHGALLAPKLNLLLSLICRAHYAELDLLNVTDVDHNCQTAEIHARVSKFNVLSGLIHGILTALVAPRLGVLSDRIGRCFVIAFIACGLLIANVIMIISAKSTSAYSYRWILAGTFFDGLTGSIVAMMSTVHAYASDCTPADKRAAAFGLFHATLFGGMAIGPAMGGYIIKVTGNILSTFYVAIFLQAIFIAAVLFIIPESVSHQHRLDAREMHRINAEFNSHRALSAREILHKLNFLEPLKILLPGDEIKSVIRKNMKLLATIDALMIGTGSGGTMIVVLYAEFSFGWTTTEAGYFMSLIGTMRAFGLVVLLPILVRFFTSRDPNGQKHVGASFSDLAIIRFATVCEVLAFLSYGLAKTGAIFAVAGTLGAIGGIASPTLQSTLTKHVAKENVGAVLGGLSLMHCIAAIVTPVIFNSIYAYTIGVYSRAVFIAFIAFFGCAALCASQLTRTTDDTIYENDYSGRNGSDYELANPQDGNSQGN